MAHIMEEEINVISENRHENSSFDRSDNTIIENCDADITDIKIVKAELSALKMFVVEQIYLVKQQLGILKNAECEQNNEILITSLNEQINYLKEENKIKTSIIQSLINQINKNNNNLSTACNKANDFNNNSYDTNNNSNNNSHSFSNSNNHFSNIHNSDPNSLKNHNGNNNNNNNNNNTNNFNNTSNNSNNSNNNSNNNNSNNNNNNNSNNNNSNDKNNNNHNNSNNNNNNNNNSDNKYNNNNNNYNRKNLSKEHVTYRRKHKSSKLLKNDNDNNNNLNNSNNNNNRNNNNKNTKQTVFILGDSMVKKVNGFFLTKDIKHKYLVKVRSFSSAKTRCMHDHVKPTIRDFNPEHIIIHVGTNDLNSEKTASQIASSIIELATSLKNKTNKIYTSLIVPRYDELNNKVNEVNIRLMNMCHARNIGCINHSDTIDPEQHLNESNIHLNKYGNIEFSKNFTNFLYNLE